MRIVDQEIINFFIQLTYISNKFEHMVIADIPKLAISENGTKAALHVSYLFDIDEPSLPLTRHMSQQLSKVFIYFQKVNGIWTILETIMYINPYANCISFDIDNSGETICFSYVLNGEYNLSLIPTPVTTNKENYLPVVNTLLDTFMGTNILFNRTGNMLLLSGIKINDNINLLCYTKNDSGIFEINNTVISEEMIKSLIFKKNVINNMALFGGIASLTKNILPTSISDFTGLTINDLKNLMESIENPGTNRRSTDIKHNT